MTLEKDFEDFIELLNQHKVDYMVVGGYALAFHGHPRHTGDLDIWIDISEANAVSMVKVIKEFGMASLGLKKSDFLKPNYMSQIGYPPIRIDILNNIDGVEFDEANPNAKIVTSDNGIAIRYIGLKDFIANKKASGRSQDLVDVKVVSKEKKKK
jgi:predicted nucleotidyltransferase